jgi:hypothetical protein
MENLCTVLPKNVSNEPGAVRALIPVKVSHPKMNAKMATRIASGTTMRKNRPPKSTIPHPMLFARTFTIAYQ